MPAKPSALPATINSMEPGTLVVSYDFEGTRRQETYANGCSNALGAAAFMFPSGHPAPVPSPLFMQNITPTVGMDAEATKWWSEHREALKATLINPLERPHAAEKFLNWMVEIITHVGKQTPVVLLASPHSYDGRHMADMLQHIADVTVRVPSLLTHPANIPQWEQLPPWVYADVGEMLAGLTHHPVQEAKANFKHFMPEDLFHVPHLDSIEQALAFFRALKSLNYSPKGAHQPPSKILPFKKR